MLQSKPRRSKVLDFDSDDDTNEPVAHASAEKRKRTAILADDDVSYVIANYSYLLIHFNHYIIGRGANRDCQDAQTTF